MGQYDQHRERSAAARREVSARGRDIYDAVHAAPLVEEPERRKRCGESLQAFCQTYFEETFFKPFSPDHLAAISKLQAAVTSGGRYAFAMPRGSGKTSLCVAACLWAVLYGRCRYVVLIGAAEKQVQSLIDGIKSDLVNNELLLADFRAELQPFVCLEGASIRAKGQMYAEALTHIGWSADSVAFASIAESAAPGSVIEIAGITGTLRGKQRTMPTGERIRPDLVIIDDPQTDESAHSPSQTDSRERIIRQTVLGLAGKRKKIAAVMPVTVIQPDDLADRFLDRDRYPDWSGERFSQLRATPTNKDRWEEYRATRMESIRLHGDIRMATAMYTTHRDEMDAGAVASWEDDYYPDAGEVSAIQHAMETRIQMGEPGWLAEMQNTPERRGAAVGDSSQMRARDLLGRLSMVRRGEVPSACHLVTAFIDVQGNSLWWAVVAWDSEYGGAIIDYGIWPQQPRSYVTMAEIPYPLEKKYPNLPTEHVIAQAVGDCARWLIGATYRRADGAELKIERMLIDSGWGEYAQTIYRVCASLPPFVSASKGIGISARNKPMSEWAPKPGERRGLHWVSRAAAGVRSVLVTIDVNWWKTFVSARLTTPIGAASAVLFPGDVAEDNQLIADHCCSEFAVQTSGQGRELSEWSRKPSKQDNHLWDCIVGAAVAASLAGLQWAPGQAAPNQSPPAKPKSLEKRRRKASRPI